MHTRKSDRLEYVSPRIAALAPLRGQYAPNTRQLDTFNSAAGGHRARTRSQSWYRTQTSAHTVSRNFGRRLLPARARTRAIAPSRPRLRPDTRLKCESRGLEPQLPHRRALPAPHLACFRFPRRLWPRVLPPLPPPALRLATRPTQTYQMPRITPSRRFRSGGRLHRARRPPEGAPSREGRIRARTVARAPAPAAPAAALAPVALVAAPDVVQPPLGSRHGAMSPLGAGGEARRAKVVTRARLVCSSQYKYCRGFFGAPWPPRGLPRAPLARTRTPSPRRALFAVRLRGGGGRGTRGEAAAKYLARKANAGNMGAARSLRVRRVARCLGCEVRLAAVGCGRVGVPWAGLGVTRGTGLGAGGRRGGAKGRGVRRRAYLCWAARAASLRQGHARVASPGHGCAHLSPEDRGSPAARQASARSRGGRHSRPNLSNLWRLLRRH